ncbi:GGDEF domain-containing protein [Acidovorax sp.]|jgi:diguanylate cyclase (GGDEF)-like protein|uniref:GGDEF domain-containing protein n=1 Tax=Acidovorax sp. TaxID=1872122 RepID=UPI0025BA7CDA|nr:GGDEF domain-containing protein [Acidovorax sp.]MBL7090860.1 GGDEF domain-containing protein [Acidovorax sp.]
MARSAPDSDIAPRTPRRFAVPQRGSSLAGKAYWAMVKQVAVMAAVIDAGYVVLFWWLGSGPLAIINLISIAMYVGAYQLVTMRRNTAAVTLIWLEVMLHAALGSLLIGWDSGFHYYLLLFIPTIVVANTRGYAVPLVLTLLAYYLGLRAVCDWLGPLTPLSPISLKWVNALHVALVFGMLSALAAFYRRTVLTAEDRLRKQATLDPLTGLNNRRHFETLATHVLARSQRDGTPVTLLLCDVDHFKRVNDERGHAVGDEVLMAIARMLGQNLRDGDVVARWGGEEFVALMPASPLDKACATAERIRAAVQATPLEVDATPLALTLSFGVAQVHGVQDLHAAIARADKALYDAKNAGRNRVSAAQEPTPAEIMPSQAAALA